MFTVSFDWGTGRARSGADLAEGVMCEAICNDNREEIQEPGRDRVKDGIRKSGPAGAKDGNRESGRERAKDEAWE